MRRWLIGLFLVLALAWFYPRAFLYPAGAYLEKTDPLAPADCLFVLAGDTRGQRILKAAELYRQGIAPRVLVSGPEGTYGYTEDELAIAFARKNGAEKVPFTGLPNKGTSTVSEGKELYPKMKEAGCRSVVVVTSNFHTRRAGRILRRVWPDIDVRVAAAPTIDYEVEGWWTNRMHQKTFFFEWAKTVADWIGL